MHRGHHYHDRPTSPVDSVRAHILALVVHRTDDPKFQAALGALDKDAATDPKRVRKILEGVPEPVRMRIDELNAEGQIPPLRPFLT